MRERKKKDQGCSWLNKLKYVKKGRGYRERKRQRKTERERDRGARGVNCLKEK